MFFFPHLLYHSQEEELQVWQLFQEKTPVLLSVTHQQARRQCLSQRRAHEVQPAEPLGPEATPAWGLSQDPIAEEGLSSRDWRRRSARRQRDGDMGVTPSKC